MSPVNAMDQKQEEVVSNGDDDEQVVGPAECSLQNVVELLDEVERQVECHRRKALSLKTEQEQLERTLKTLAALPEEMGLGDADREDMAAHVDRLSRRLGGVDVSVLVKRDPSQEEALTVVERKLDELVLGIQQRHPDAPATLRGFLAAASVDRESERERAVKAAVDPKFEGFLLSCASEDQKRVKEKLERIQTCTKAVEDAECDREEASTDSPADQN